MYKVNDIEEFYDTLDQGHRIYLGTKIGKCVIPDIMGYAERHDMNGITVEGISERKLKECPYYLYYMQNNRVMDNNNEIVRVSFFKPGASNITLFNKTMIDAEGFKKSEADGIIFFIPEYIDDRRYDSIIRRR